LPPQKSFLGQQKPFVPEQKGFLPREKGFVGQQKRFLVQQNGFLPEQNGFVAQKCGSFSTGSARAGGFLSEGTDAARQWWTVFPEFWTGPEHGPGVLCGAGVGKAQAIIQTPFESYATVSEVDMSSQYDGF
jgi:hypothetical protein